MSETNKPETKLDWLIIGANWAAIVIVTIASVALILIVSSLIGKDPENTAPKEIVVKYEISVDTSSIKKNKDSATIKAIKGLDENNKKILNEINSSVDAQYKRMESILSVQEDRSKLFSYGAGFLAILVAIATFFGFKSINEMKKSTIETAEYEAQKIAETKAKEVAQTVAEEKTKRVLAKKLDGIKTELQTSLTSDFQSKLDQRELVISEEELNKLRSEFNERVDKLFEESDVQKEKTDSHQPSSSESKEKNEEQIMLDGDNTNSNDGRLFNDDDLIK